MIDPSNGNRASAVYFLSLWKKKLKSPSYGGGIWPLQAPASSKSHMGALRWFFGNFWYLFYAVAKSRSRYPTYLYSDLRSIHMVGSYGHFNFGQKFISCLKKKKNQVPIASHHLLWWYIRVKKSGVAQSTFCSCVKIPKITELQGGIWPLQAPTSSKSHMGALRWFSVIFGICFTQWQKVDLATPLFFTRI